MNVYRPAPSDNWKLALKIIAFIFALYLSALIISKIFSWFFVALFFVIKYVIILGVTFLIIHLLLKLIFNIDLIRMIFPYYRR